MAKFHRQDGHEVFLIANEWTFDSRGKRTKTAENDYVNEDGVCVIRIKSASGIIGESLRIYPRFEFIVKELHPDVLFVHGCQFWSLRSIIPYLEENKNIKVYIDNHADYSNSAKSWISKNILHGLIWRKCAQRIEPYTVKFYGVLPARVDFLKEMYGLPSEKCELLLMGADDEWIKEAASDEQKKRLRSACKFDDDDFIIVTGGKINTYRPETLQLMEAVAESIEPKIKLIVFGNVDSSLKDRFDEICKSPKIRYVGWKKAKDTYKYMAAANLVVFPGLHSVMWEQAVALGVPCIFRDIEGYHHVDLGGNALFVKDVTTKGLIEAIESVYLNPVAYERMKSVACKRGLNEFSYSKIARKSIKLI